MSDKSIMKGIFTHTALAASIIALAAGCSSSNSGSSDSNIYQQAIDGYIVGAEVVCDGTATGKTTGAAGRYACPEGSILAVISGGSDVGFDENKTSGGVAFTGVLSGPTSAAYVTPISTLAVELAKDADGNYDPAKLADALETVKKALGLTSLDLDTNPASDITMAKVNAQVHQIVGSLASTNEDYKKVMASFAEVVKTKAQAGAVVKLSGDLSETLSALNEAVGRTAPGAKVKPSDLNDIIKTVQDTNNGIQNATDPQDAANKAGMATNARKDFVIAIDKYKGPVIFSDAGGNTFTYTTIQYETDTKTNGKYTAQLTRGIKRISYDPSAIRVGKTVSDVPVSVGIEIKSMDDNRILSVIGTGLKLSATKGDPTSIKFTVPAGSYWSFHGVTGTGKQVDTAKLKNDTRIFDASNNGININFDKISEAITNRGYPDLTKSEGNFKVTLIINGIRVNRISGDEPNRNIFPAFPYDVTVDEYHTLRGPGFQGYVTVLGDGSGNGSGG